MRTGLLCGSNRLPIWCALLKIALAPACPARHPPLCLHTASPAGELRLVGISQPEKIAQISVRNDAAFLWSTVGITSVLALVLGQLPGDWGFFSAYLAGEQGGTHAWRPGQVMSGGQLLLHASLYAVA